MKTVLYDWGGLNEWLFMQINGLQHPLLQALMRLGSRLAEYDALALYAGAVALIGVLAIRRHARLDDHTAHAVVGLWFSILAVLSLSLAIDALLIPLVKAACDFPRPLRVLPPAAVHIVGEPKFNYSLPSGHAALATTIAASVWPVVPRVWRVGLVLFVSWVCVSRISLGMHFPADVIAGAGISLAVVLLVRRWVRKALPTAEPHQ